MKYAKQLSIVTIFLMLAVPVLANPILDFVQEKTTWLFFGLGDSVDDQVLVLRLLLFVVLFSLLYAVTSIGPMAHFPGNARTMLSIALSLISVVIIPVEVLLSISSAYGALFTLLMLGVPTVGVTYLALTKLSEETVANYSLKAVICLTLWYVLNAYDATVAKSAELSTIATTISGLVSTLSLAFMVYGFYSVCAAIRVHGKGKVEGVVGWGWNKIFGFGTKTDFSLDRAKIVLNTLEDNLKKNKPADVLVNATGVLQNVVHVLDTLHSELEAELVNLPDSNQKTAATKKLADIETTIRNAEQSVNDIISDANGVVAGGTFTPAQLKTLNRDAVLLRKDITSAAVAVEKIKEFISQARTTAP